MIEMHEFVEKLIEYYEAWPPIPVGSSSVTVPQTALALRAAHYYDCTQISEYAYEATYREYQDLQVPPSADTILPNPTVGLFVDLNDRTAAAHYVDADIKQKRYNLLLLVPNAKKINDELQIETAPTVDGKPFTPGVPYNDLDGEIVKPRLYYKNFVVLSCYLSANTMPHPIGTIECRTVAGIDVSTFNFDVANLEEQDDLRNQADATWLRHTATFLHLINKPRFVKQASPYSRQRRKGFHRGGGFAVDAWHRVSWNVDKPVAAKEPYDTTFHKMPLHFNKGHWKKAKEHHPKSILRNGDWKTWIEGYWAGHPAFGFKKQYWKPTKGAA